MAGQPILRFPLSLGEDAEVARGRARNEQALADPSKRLVLVGRICTRRDGTRVHIMEFAANSGLARAGAR